MDFYKHRDGNKQGWWKTKMDFDKCGGWNKRGGWNIFMKSINMEGGFFLWRVEFFKIGKRDFTFIREMRVDEKTWGGKTFSKKLRCLAHLLGSSEHKKWHRLFRK